MMDKITIARKTGQLSPAGYDKNCKKKNNVDVNLTVYK